MNKKRELKLKAYYWKNDLVDNKYKILVAIILLVTAFFLNYFAGNYTNKIQGNPVEDVILDHFGPVDLEIFFVWWYLAIIIVFFAYPLFFKPDRLHVAIVMFSLLIFVRSLFICLTHLTMPPLAVPVHFPWILNYFRFQNDLFFSGHTSFPFLGLLIFKNKIIKYFMLFSSITMAITVLLMHQHYSIDVFAAFFITYGVYKIGNRGFKENLS